MNFPCKENENYLRQHCFEFQDAPLCTIWDHLNKLCHECGLKIDHLAWKPWIFTHDSSFLRTLFKTNFGHSGNGKWIFRTKKMKTPFGNIVWNSKMHTCAQYEIIWTKYVMNVAIRLIIWLESPESSRMIAHFWEHFLK